MEEFLKLSEWEASVTYPHCEEILKTTFQKALWMVDPFQELSSSLQRPIAATLQALLHQPKMVIEPVFIIKMNFEAACDDTHRWQSEYCMAAEDAVASWINQSNIQGIEPPHVICHESLSTDAAINELLEYAKKAKADLFITQSHGRKDFGRFFIGSFTDRLILKSPIPVLVINPQSEALSGNQTQPFNRERAQKAFPKLLFPTDFSKPANEQFGEVLQFAQAFHSKILLFHSVQHPIEPVPIAKLLKMDSRISIPEYIKRKAQSARENAKCLESEARKQYTQIETIIDEMGTPVWSEILNTARDRDVDIIIMSTQMSPGEARLPGSTIRQVVRNALVPVLVLVSK